MLRASCVGVILIGLMLLGVGRGQAQQDTPKGKQADAVAIQGLWKVASAGIAGSKADDAKKQGLEFLIGPNTFLIRSGESVLRRATFALDPSADPKAIDLWATHKLTLGIYELEGDRMKLWLSESAAGRPQEFAMDAQGMAAGYTVLELVREKAAGEVEIPASRAAIAASKMTPDEVTAIQDRPLTVVNADGSGLRQFTGSAIYTAGGSPNWSADGKKIAYDTWRASVGENYFKAHIFAVDSTGGKPDDLGPGAMPSWSPDGTRIALSMYSPFRGVWTMNANGSGRTLLDANGWSAEWSPAGEQIAYTLYRNEANLCVVDLTTNKRTRLLDRDYRQIYWGITWSADGQWICFKGVRPDRTIEVAVVHAQGEKKGFRVVLGDDLPQPVLNTVMPALSWSGRGQPIVVSMKMETDSQRQLYLVDPEAKEAPQRLPGQDPECDNADPAWSPDGSQIAFGPRRPAI